LDINLEDKNAACLNIDYYEKVIYTVDDSMTVRLYDVRSEDLIYDVNMKKFSDKNCKEGSITALDIINTNQFLLGGNFSTRLFDLRKKDLSYALDGDTIESEENLDLKNFIVHTDSHIYQTRLNNNTTKIYDFNSFELVKEIVRHKTDEDTVILDIQVVPEYQEILLLSEITTRKFDEPISSKKILTKLRPCDEVLEISDIIEVPSYAKRLRISGPNSNIILEGNNQIGLWLYRYKDLESELRKCIEDKLFTLGGGNNSPRFN